MQFIIGLYITVLCLIVNINSEELETESRVRENKARKFEKFIFLIFQKLYHYFEIILVPVFQVVKFPNDICIVSGGSKNGTCYTS